MKNLQAEAGNSFRDAESCTSAGCSNGPKQSHSVRFWHSTVDVDIKIKRVFSPAERGMAVHESES